MDSNKIPGSRTSQGQQNPPAEQPATQGVTPSGQTVSNTGTSATAGIRRDQLLPADQPVNKRTVERATLEEPFLVRFKAKHKNTPTPKQQYKCHELVFSQRIYMHANTNSKASSEDFEFLSCGFSTRLNSLESRIAREMAAKGLAKFVPDLRQGWLTVEYIYPSDLYGQIQRVEQALAEPAPGIKTKLETRSVQHSEASMTEVGATDRPENIRLEKRSVSRRTQIKGYLNRFTAWVRRWPSPPQQLKIVEALKSRVMPQENSQGGLKVSNGRLEMEKGSAWHQGCLILEAAGLAKLRPAAGNHIVAELKRPDFESRQLEAVQLLSELPSIEFTDQGLVNWKETLRTLNPLITERLLNLRLLIADKSDYHMAPMTTDNLQHLRQVFQTASKI